MIETRPKKGWQVNGKVILTVLVGVLLFMLSIDLMTYSLGRMNNQVANEIFLATKNPFVGLFVGILMTALIQSSSTTSAMVVAVVASGSIELGQAVPLIMGANIGTTLTSNLVALGFIMNKKRFKKALSAAVLHDFFNIITAIILFPLEVYFGFLSNLASYISQALFVGFESTGQGYGTQGIFLRPLTLRLAGQIGYPVLILILGVLLLFLSIKMLSSSTYKSLISPQFDKVSKHIFQLPARAFAYGVFSTAAVQSSTITTSLIVTFVANGKVSLQKVFPFILGANIGTTITAGIAALYKTEAAISIAIVHFLFNGIGTLIFLPFPNIRDIPVRLASLFGKQTVKTRYVGLLYILLTFFIIPFFLIFFSKGEASETTEKEKEAPEKKELGEANVNKPAPLKMPWQ
ncbi:Na/Pi symporter [Pleomorphovibrio marinus]|uniref:Na/Pi symporter n=1 Tax=Pleomorphovibrio marinus TaxID=2164132 RepID=UPI000E0A380E|nr:Na/Pi symporter [Pleomorphovibrio marinus]